MSDIRQARRVLTSRILEGDGKASTVARQAAFNNSGLAEPLSTLVNKVARHADSVTDDDFTATEVSGLSEDQIFEIVVCAAIGQATRQYETAIAALDVASGKK
jgi:hypothetical protein